MQIMTDSMKYRLLRMISVLHATTVCEHRTVQELITKVALV